MKFHLLIDPAAEEQVVATVRDRSPLTDQIEALVLAYTGDNRLAVYDGSNPAFLSFDQIECITVIDGKTYAVDTQGTQRRLKQRLYELEAALPACFIRINKSALANETKLDRFVTTFSGGVNARFLSGYEEYVSRRCFAAIKRRYGA